MVNESLKQSSILIVDDQQANVDLLMGVLEMNKYSNLKSTTDARQVVRLFGEFQPDLILLDLMMPHLDGFQVMEQLLTLVPPGAYLPILVLTADATRDARQRALANGAKDFLTKPFDVTEVALRVKNLLETRQLHLQQQRQSQLLEEKVRERTAQLAASEIFSRAVLDSLTAHIAVLDKHGAIIAVNESWQRFARENCGVRPVMQTIGTNYLSVLEDAIRSGDESAPAALDGIRAVLAGTQETFELEYACPSPAERRWFMMRVVTRSGERGGIVIAHQNITEGKKAQDAVHQSESRYRALVEQAADGIFITDAQGRYLDVNTSGCAMLGYTRAELLGADYRLILLLDDVAQDPPNFALLRDGTTLVRERFYKRKDGTLFPVEISAKLLSDGRIQSIVRDSSERKRTEAALHRRLAELEIVRSVSVALRMAQNIDEALPILLDETLSALETDTGMIWLYHPEQDELRAEVTRNWLKQFEKSLLKPGVGIIGTVFAGGQPHLSADFAGDSQRLPTANEQIPAGWAAACLPIRAGAITVGVLFVAVPPSHLITPEQMKLLESLAEMGGAAIHRMSLFDETALQLNRLEALHDIDLTISSSMDLPMTLDILLQHVRAELDVDAADVLVLNPSLNTLSYVAGNGFRTRRVQTTQVRLGERFAGLAALERRIVQVNDPALAHVHAQFASLWDAEQFAGYYGVPLVAKGRVKGVLEVYRRTPFKPGPAWTGFLETLAGQAAIAIESAQLFENLQRSNMDLALAYDATIEGWSRALDLRDKETEGHTQRVAELTLRLARSLGLSESEMVHIRRGALLHDIGKMGVPDNILLKPGPLTDAEWVVMRRHPVYAYELLSPIAFLRPALDIPYCHHEKWDGSGYPRGLCAEQIPPSARLFAIIDVWDALLSDRPYRPAWPEEKVRTHIQALAGTHFDPNVVTDFLRML